MLFIGSLTEALGLLDWLYPKVAVYLANSRVAYASWLAQTKLNDKTPTSLKLTTLALTKLDQN